MYYVADEEGAVGGKSENTVVIQYATRATAKTAKTNLIKEILQDIRYRRDPEMIVAKGNRMKKIFTELQKLHNAHLDDLLLKRSRQKKDGSMLPPLISMAHATEFMFTLIK